jgi:uncharacterized protein (DUF2235 family)
MKRIVLCFDGTWNRPADENLPSDKQVETNVRRFYESLQETGTDGIKQVKWYDQGVGTHWYDQFIGGASERVHVIFESCVSNYSALTRNLKPGTRKLVQRG